MPVGEGQMETVAHDGSGDGGGGRRKEVLGWAGREGGGGLGRCHCSCSSCCFPPPTRPESACVCSSPVAAQRGMICRNNQREESARCCRLRAQSCPPSEGNSLACPVNMDLQRSTLT